MQGIRLLTCGALAVALTAQVRYPGQTSPYPPGQIPGQTGPYPGGRNPNGPFPGGIGGGGRSSPSSGRPSKDKVISIITLGNLRVARANQLVLEAADHRIITYKITGKTTVERDGKAVEITSFQAGDHLTVDAVSDENGFFTALGVVFNLVGTPAERTAALRTWDLPRLDAQANSGALDQDSDDARPVIRRANDKNDKNDKKESAPASDGGKAAEAAPEPAQDLRAATITSPSESAPDPDDPGRPQLRRGRPSVRTTPENTPQEPSEKAAASAPQASNVPAAQPPAAEAQEPANTVPFIAVEEDPIIVKAREVATAYSSESLPNFLVRQVVTRYDSDNPKQGWNARDTVTADVKSENGVEDYSNIKVGSRTVKSIDDTGGAWSTGQFTGIQDDLFEPATAAAFRKSGQDTIQGRRADVFSFDVKRENSRWRVIAAGQLYYPAYRGKIWIDKPTTRVLRLEIESRGIPALFPYVKVETAVDYEFVRLAATQAFLLPTVGEVLMCEQGSSRCSRNRIEYRNYRKFGAESGISFEDNK